MIATNTDLFFLINFIYLILLSTPHVPFKWRSVNIFLKLELLDQYLGQMNYNCFISADDIRVIFRTLWNLEIEYKVTLGFLDGSGLISA